MITLRTTAAVVIVTCVAAGLLVGAALASHGDAQTDFEVTPDNHNTGEEDVRYVFTAELNDTVDRSPSVAYPERIEYTVPSADVNGCEGQVGLPLPIDNYVIGVNQSTDDGWEFKEYEVEDVEFDGDTATFTFPEEDEDTDQPDYRRGDRLVLQLNDCVNNINKSGWYQATIDLEGFSRNDREIGFTSESHYYGLCEGCEDDDDARTELGNPPSEQSTPTPEPTATPTATPSPTPEPTATPTATPSPTPEPTATPTATPSPTPEPTPTPTEADDEVEGDETDDDAELLGMSPIVLVGLVAILAIGLAAVASRQL